MNGAFRTTRFQEMRAAIRRDPVVWSVALLLGLIYVPVAGRYDTFRDELYFIVCGRHPAFGYADLPPLVPFIAAASQLFGDHTWLLRLPGIAAAIALVPLTAAFARTLGGGAASAWMAGVAAGIAPMLVGIASPRSGCWLTGTRHRGPGRARSAAARRDYPVRAQGRERLADGPS